MDHKEKLLSLLLGRDLVAAVEAELCQISPDFRELRAQYSAAAEELCREPGGREAAERYLSAVYRRSAACLCFAGALGLRMNYEHFQTPLAPNCTWEQVESEDYLGIRQAYNLPACRAARAEMEAFQEKLSPDDQKHFDAVTEYWTALEVYGMKVAHYRGYLLGNQLLYACVPGYCPDPVLTMRYTRMFEKNWAR